MFLTLLKKKTFFPRLKLSLINNSNPRFSFQSRKNFLCYILCNAALVLVRLLSLKNTFVSLSNCKESLALLRISTLCFYLSLIFGIRFPLFIKPVPLQGWQLGKAPATKAQSWMPRGGSFSRDLPDHGDWKEVIIISHVYNSSHSTGITFSKSI